jgi:hypothetical protein
MADKPKRVSRSLVRKEVPGAVAELAVDPDSLLPKRKEWGIYIYFAADVPNPEMQAAVWTTLETIASVGSNPSVGITAMIDLPGRDTEYYIIPPRPTDATITRWALIPDRFLSNVDSASIDAIIDFLDWSHSNCPAKKIALIFWGHGYALDDYDPRIQQKVASVYPAQACGAMGRAAGTFPADNGGELKLLYDYTHNSVLNNRDFAQAVREFTETTNRRSPIQVLGLDCCNMAMAEVLAELQGLTEYAIAAETALPFQSWVSAPILQKFLADPGINAKQFAVTAVKDFVSYMSRSINTYVELSACNMELFGKLEADMKKFVDVLLPAINEHENRLAIAQAWLSDVSFLPDGMIDLSSFCDLLRKTIPKNAANDAHGNPVLTDIQKAVIKAAREVQGAVHAVVEDREVAPQFPGRKIALSKGISIWFPPWIQFPGVRYVQMEQSQDYLFDGYSTTLFARVTGWDCFLQELFFLTQD